MKYVLLTEDKFCSEGKMLFRIRAERDIPSQGVKKGDFGGFVHDIKNLPQSNEAWIGGNAQVLGEAIVSGNARIGGNAIIKGKSSIGGSVKVIGSAVLDDVALKGREFEIREQARLKNVTLIAEQTLIHGFAQVENIQDGSSVYGLEIGGRSVIISDGSLMDLTGLNMVIDGNAHIENVPYISGEHLLITGDSVVENGVKINGKNITIKDYAHISGKLEIGNNFSISDVASLKRGLVDSLPFKNMTIDGDVALSTNAFEPPHDPFGGL